MEKIRLTAEILKTEDRPEVWTVEAIDDKSGDVYSAMFVGPRARERAQEYAVEKFAEHRVSAAA